jgi:hypothetical protein
MLARKRTPKDVLALVRDSILIMSLLLVSQQASAEPRIGAALKGGLDAATLAEDNRSDRYGFTGGVSGYLLQSLTGSFFMGGQLDLLYTSRGADVVSDGKSLGETRLQYFDILLAARPEKRFGPVSVYLLVGGGLNILLNASQVDSLGGEQDIIDGLHRVDVELLGGAGVALQLPRRGFRPVYLGAFFLEARRDYGLIGIDAVNGGFVNRTSSLMFGLSFELSSKDANMVPASSPVTSGWNPQSNAITRSE